MNNYYWTDESIKALWQEILNKINNLNFDDINAQDIIDLQNKIANLQQTVESLETLKNTVAKLSTQQERLNDRINKIHLFMILHFFYLQFYWSRWGQCC